MDDEESRTVWCGNLNEKVTDDLLYELFIQGGPVEKVNIPKDRVGKQRSFGFVTYKHKSSVPYALKLFEGTSLFNRELCLQTRNTDQMQTQMPQEPQGQFFDINQMIQMGNQMLLGNLMPHLNMYNMYPSNYMVPNQAPYFPQADSRRQQQRPHPYRRDGDRDNRSNERETRDNRGSERDTRESRGSQDHKSHRNKRTSNWNRSNSRRHH